MSKDKSEVEKQVRGFAALPPEKQREIASKGGKAAHAAGTAHEWNSEEAKAAGKKGGDSHSREYMQEIGRRGGKKRAENVRLRAEGKR